ncbi:MAG: PHP domain-containing protein [Lachnospiraceae bacterium]|nr:PHP domain-containing protein [Lachnospiraceae bacterium]
MVEITQYKYKYELHLHTSQASACGHNTGAEMAKAAKEAGYDGIVVTDHAWGGNTCIDRSLPWEEWVRGYIKGYEDAKDWGDKNGLTVMFGLETGFEGTEFLIYGITPEYLISRPEFRTATIPEQLPLVHEGGGIVMQAHPYREEYYIPEIRLFPDDVDGVETINATHSSHLSKAHTGIEYNDKAIEYALSHGFHTCAGSDVHSTVMFGGGIMTREKIKESKDLVKLLMSDEMYLLTDGDRIYDKYGTLLKDYEG